MKLNQGSFRHKEDGLRLMPNQEMLKFDRHRALREYHSHGTHSYDTEINHQNTKVMVGQYTELGTLACGRCGTVLHKANTR